MAGAVLGGIIGRIAGGGSGRKPWLRRAIKAIGVVVGGLVGFVVGVLANQKLFWEFWNYHPGR
jgi:hypothetical protein